LIYHPSDIETGDFVVAKATKVLFLYYKTKVMKYIIVKFECM